MPRPGAGGARQRERGAHRAAAGHECERVVLRLDAHAIAQLLTGAAERLIPRVPARGSWRRNRAEAWRMAA